MSPMRRFFQLSYNVTECYNNTFRRSNWITLVQLQTCKYTKKSAEEMLGIEKPKRPLTPFFKFMLQMRPALNTKIPGISAKEAVVWSSKHWQQLDHETKSMLKKEYEDDLINYRKKQAIYEASLTEEQKEDIKNVKKEIISLQEKRKLKIEMREMGKPKKPMSSYLLYAQSRKDLFQSNQLKEHQEKVKASWLNLPESERVQFDRRARDLMKKYKKDVEAWELKMISMGHLHLVRQKPEKQKKPKIVKST